MAKEKYGGKRRGGGEKVSSRAAYEEEEQRGETSARCQRGGDGGGKKSGGTRDKSVTGFQQNSDGGGVRRRKKRRRRRRCHIFSRSHREMDSHRQCLHHTSPPRPPWYNCNGRQRVLSSSLVVTLQLPIRCVDSMTPRQYSELQDSTVMLTFCYARYNPATAFVAVSDLV